jgi:hypothetical protein
MNRETPSTPHKKKRHKAPPKVSSIPTRLILYVGVALIILFYFIQNQLGLSNSGVPPVDLRVHVVDASRHPIPGATVEFIRKTTPFAAPSYTTKTNQEGIALLPKKLADSEYYVKVQRLDGTRSITAILDREPELNSLEIADPEPLQGTVIDDRAGPLANVLISAHVGGYRTPPLATTRSDKKGRWRFDNISSSLDFFDLRAQIKGKAEGRTSWSRIEGGQVDFLLEKGLPLKVQVVLPKWKAAAGIPVKVLGNPQLDGKTNKDGLLILKDLPLAQHFFFHIEHPSLTYRRRDGIQPGNTVTIQLEPPATISGTLVNMRGEPVPNVTLMHPHGPRAWVRTQSGGMGRFKIGDLPSGRVTLQFKSPDGLSGTVVVDKIKKGEHRENMVLKLLPN